MTKLTKATVQKHADNLVGALDNAVSHNAQGETLGQQVREEARWALDTLGETPALDFLAQCTAKAQQHYIDKNPRPTGGALDPVVVKWRNTFGNAYRSVKTELDERKTSNVLAATARAPERLNT